MSDARPLRLLTHILTGSIGVSAALALTGVTTARWLGPTDRGSLLLVTSISASMATVGVLGYSIEGRRRIVTEPNEPFLRKSIARSLFSALLSLMAWFLFCLVTDTSQSYFLAICTGALGFTFALILQIQNGLYGLEVFSHTNAILATGAFAQVGALCLLEYQNWLTLKSALSVLLASSVVVSLLLLGKLRASRLIECGDMGSSNGESQNIHARWALFPPLVNQFYLSWDRIFIGVVASTSAVAYFGVAATLSSLTLIFALAAGQLVQAAAKDSSRLASIKPHVRNFMTASVVSGIVLFFIAPEIIAMIFGSSYSNAVPATRILLLSVPFQVYSVIETSLMIGRHQYRRASVLGATGIVIDCAAILLLVPRWEEAGAALATLLAYVVTASILLILRFRTHFCAIPTKQEATD